MRFCLTEANWYQQVLQKPGTLLRFRVWVYSSLRATERALTEGGDKGLVSLSAQRTRSCGHAGMQLLNQRVAVATPQKRCKERNYPRALRGLEREDDTLPKYYDLSGVYRRG